MRGSKDEAMDRALLIWFQWIQTENTAISGGLMMGKPNKLAKDLNIEFMITNGWLERYRTRNDRKLDNQNTTFPFEKTPNKSHL